MRCLVVVAHPLPASLCRTLAEHARLTLETSGHDVQWLDLYEEGFRPALTPAERGSYYSGSFDNAAVQHLAESLQAADALLLCFPTWWFGLPAILKGWFDRVWGPGLAYDHAADLGAIRPRLLRLHQVLAVTSLGSAWWVDWFVMRRPVHRVLKTAVLGTCAPRARFRMLSIYRAEQLSNRQVQQATERLDRALKHWH